MAKRRYKATKKRRSVRKSASIFGVNVGKATAAMLYGASRAKISNLLAPYTSKIPLGNISDEVGMYLALMAGKKFLFKGASVMRDAANIGQMIEMARIGDAVISGDLGINLGGASATSNGNIF